MAPAILVLISVLLERFDSFEYKPIVALRHVYIVFEEANIVRAVYF